MSVRTKAELHEAFRSMAEGIPTEGELWIEEQTFQFSSKLAQVAKLTRHEGRERRLMLPSEELTLLL